MPGFPGKFTRGLELSQAAVENICYNNYEKLVGKEMATVDMGGVYECAERMLFDIKDNGMEQDIIWLENFLKNN